jgi:hypothetical protein
LVVPTGQRSSWERIGANVKFVIDGGYSFLEGIHNPETNTISGTISRSNGTASTFILTHLGSSSGRVPDNEFWVNTDVWIPVTDRPPPGSEVRSIVGGGGASIIAGAEILMYVGRNTVLRIPTSIRREGFVYQVIGIGDNAFREIGLTEVIIPNDVRWIRNAAFHGNQLTNVTVAAGFVGNHAFSTNRLTGVTLTGGVTEIGDAAFANNQLTEIVIPNSVTVIGAGVFANNRLTNFTLSSNVRIIPDRAFRSNHLTNVIVPNGVTRIGENAFADNPLTSVTLPNSLTHIAASAFTGANNLTQITIGPNVNFIGTDLMPFNFRGVYIENSLRAGTYTFSNGQWRVDFR